MQTRNKTAWVFFIAILLVFIVYAALYIHNTSFVIDGERYYVLFDDAMVSMRFARNLADGHGLVWNPGDEPVEGFTNPLWVVFMSAFHLFPIPASRVSLFIQISGAVLLFFTLFFVKWIADELTGEAIVGLLAVLMTAFYLPLITWTLLGMEVSILVLALSGAIWIAIRGMRRDTFSAWLYVILGLTTLVRIDMVVPYMVILLVLLISDQKHRRQHLVWGVGLLVFSILGQTLLRVLYYGEPLPNTYYLKMAGYPIINRIKRGIYTLFLFGWQLNWLLLFLPLTILIFRRDRQVMLLLLVIVGQFAYSIYVGGDAWEHKGGANRYIAIVMPIFFLLLIYAFRLIIQVVVKSLPDRKRWIRVLSDGLLVLISCVALFNANVLVDFKSIERWVLIRRPEFTRGSEHVVRLALDVKSITNPEASIAVVTAGSIPYFSERYSIDLLGKNDPVIAHEKPRHLGSTYNLELFRPGHMKWNYQYSIGELQPDVVVQLWGDTDEAEEYMANYVPWRGEYSNQTIYLRSDSQNINR
jgi:hypothetical protein